MRDPVVATGITILITAGIFLAYPWTAAAALTAVFLWYAIKHLPNETWRPTRCEGMSEKIYPRRRAITLFILIAVGLAIAALTHCFIPAATAVAIGLAVALTVNTIKARQARNTALCARADLQHAQVLSGDDRGIYGQHPPARTP